MHLADLLLGGGVEGGEGLAADGVHPLVVDEELRELHLGARHLAPLMILIRCKWRFCCLLLVQKVPTSVLTQASQSQVETTCLIAYSLQPTPSIVLSNSTLHCLPIHCKTFLVQYR